MTTTTNPHKGINPAHVDSVPLWECPCRECTKLDYDITIAGDDRPITLKAFRYEQFPEVWPDPA